MMALAKALRRNEGWTYGIAIFSFSIWAAAMIFAIYTLWSVPNSWPPPEDPVVTGKVTEAIVWLEDNAAIWTHECCDCALTHQVILVVSPNLDYVEMFWEVNAQDTRKKRRMKGLWDEWVTPRPWKPERRNER